MSDRHAIIADSTEDGDTPRTQLIVSYGDNAWADLDGEDIVGGRLVRAVLLPFGTQSGNHTVELLIRTSGGQLIHANTTYALFRGMAEVLDHWFRHR